MQEYIYYIFKNEIYREGTLQTVKLIINEESYLVKNGGSYMVPVYLYRKMTDNKWHVLSTTEEFLNFMLNKEENTVILYAFQRRHVAYIYTAIKKRKKELIEKERIKTIQEEITKKEYTTKEFYNTNNLFVANIAYGSNLFESLSLTNNQTSQKYIFELVRTESGNIYIEIFSGFIASDMPISDCPFSLVDIEPLDNCFSNIKETEISKLELFLLQNKINLQKLEPKKGIFRIKNRTP